MKNHQVAITKFFSKTIGTGRTLALVGHTPVLLCDGDPEIDAEGESLPVETHVYWPEDWEGYSSPTALLDKDGDAALISGDGRPYAWAPLRHPRCMSEARRFARLWQRVATV